MAHGALAEIMVTNDDNKDRRPILITLVASIFAVLLILCLSTPHIKNNSNKIEVTSDQNNWQLRDWQDPKSVAPRLCPQPSGPFVATEDYALRATHKEEVSSFHAAAIDTTFSLTIDPTYIHQLPWIGGVSITLNI